MVPEKTPSTELLQIDRQIDDMLAKGLIQPTDSEWASPVLMVNKGIGLSTSVSTIEDLMISQGITHSLCQISMDS